MFTQRETHGKGERIMDAKEREARTQKIKAEVFDLIRQQETHQAQINTLQKTKATLLRGLEKLEALQEEKYHV